MRIEVGYGLEGVLTDAISKLIIANAAAPRFKAGDYDGGVTRARRRHRHGADDGRVGLAEEAGAASAEERRFQRRISSFPFIIFLIICSSSGD